MKVVLVGDSIRIGYEPFVRRALAGVAEVWAPEQNGGNSRNVIEHLDEWVLDQQPDVLHLNCGLHDLKREPGASGPAIALEDYATNLRALFRRLAHARIPTIWATSTPVNETWHARGTLHRLEEDVIAYNRISAGVAEQFGLSVNDLYCLVTSRGRDLLLSQDGRHFVPDGYALLGEAVAAAIAAKLSRTNAASRMPSDAR